MLGLLSKISKAAPPSAVQEEASDDWVMHAALPVAIVDSGGRVIKSSSPWTDEFGANALPHLVAAGATTDIQTASKRWLRLSISDISGHTQGHKLCVATDISDLKNDYYRQILDTFQDCVKVMDTQGRLLFLNTTGRTVLGVAPDQPLGMLWTDLLPPSSTDKINQIIEQVVAGETARFTNQSQLPAREAEIWQHTLMPYRDNEGRVIAILCMSRNITADYSRQISSRQNEERLELAARAAGMGMWDLDLQTGRIHCNETWYEVMGISTDMAIATIDQFFALLHPDDRKRLEHDWQNHIQVLADTDEYKTRFRRVAEGGTLSVSITSVVIRDIADKPVRAIGFVTRDPQ